MAALAVFTLHLGCHEAEEENRHDALPAERATGLDGGGKDTVYELMQRMTTGSVSDGSPEQMAKLNSRVAERVPSEEGIEG